MSMADTLVHINGSFKFRNDSLKSIDRGPVICFFMHDQDSCCRVWSSLMSQKAHRPLSLPFLTPKRSYSTWDSPRTVAILCAQSSPGGQTRPSTTSELHILNQLPFGVA